jgi:signal transduction histidine kinase
MRSTAPCARGAERGARSNWSARAIVGYWRYSAFSWDWTWRRCILFAVFGSLFSVWAGAAAGAILESRDIGFAIGLRMAAELVVAICVGPLTASGMRSREWPRRREMLGVVAAVILGVAAASACHGLGDRYIHPLGLPRTSLTRRTASRMMLPRALEIDNSPLPLLGRCVVFLLLGGGLALPSYFAERRRLIEEARERELGELQLQKQEADLQMLVLQAQIEPHFLFNTLASLRSLMRQDVDRAEAMVDALVGHLRAVIPVFRESKGRSILSEQLRISCSYLELMRVRLADRLRYTIDVPDALRSVPFPPLILLTLIENAVKHGIEPKPGQGIIQIDARRERHMDGPHIKVSVTDNGVGLSPGLGHGVGLSNVRAQLALKYGARAALSLMSGIEGGAVASIDIPEFEANESAISAKATSAR